MPTVRIQKLLSDAGVASRRAVEQMILEGRITVNGDLVTELPCFVDAAKDDIVVDGRAVPKRAAVKTYILFNKPRGVVTSEMDTLGRPRVFDIVPSRERLLCPTPLDEESSGIVLLTNDGELQERLSRPGGGLMRQYVVEIDGRLDEEAMQELRQGAYIDERRTRGAIVKGLTRSATRSMIEVDLVETVTREVRRVLARVGHKVRRLKRVGLGLLSEQGLKIGHWRNLSPHEVRQLLAGEGGQMPAPAADQREQRQRPHRGGPRRRVPAGEEGAKGGSRSGSTRGKGEGTYSKGKGTYGKGEGTYGKDSRGKGGGSYGKGEGAYNKGDAAAGKGGAAGGKRGGTYGKGEGAYSKGGTKRPTNEGTYGKGGGTYSKGGAAPGKGGGTYGKKGGTYGKGGGSYGKGGAAPGKGGAAGGKGGGSHGKSGGSHGKGGAGPGKGGSHGKGGGTYGKGGGPRGKGGGGPHGKGGGPRGKGGGGTSGGKGTGGRPRRP